MKFETLSKKQAEIFRFAADEKNVLICDGAVRSGKTATMAAGFLLWAMANYNKGFFGICAVSKRQAERNIVMPLMNIDGIRRHYVLKYNISGGVLTVRDAARGIENQLVIYGGKDEGSYKLIQGITLCGILFDEVTLMPESFVNQAIARTLSVDGAKLWFNCNPAGKEHWFYKEWISKAEEKSVTRLHFLMEDNPSLSAGALSRAKNRFNGVFYDRYILGLWACAEGSVYRQFIENKADFIIHEAPKDIMYSQIGVDFGGNGSAHAFVLTGFSRDFRRIYVLDEWYYKGNITPGELEAAFVNFVRKNIEFNPIIAFMDSAEQVLIRGIKATCAGNGLSISIRNAAKGPIIGRIRFYNSIMARGIYKIMDHCDHLTEAFEAAVYDGKSVKDSRLDNGSTNIDSLDAAEYSTENVQDNVITLTALG